MIRLLCCVLLCVMVNCDTTPVVKPVLGPYGPGIVPPVNPLNPAAPLYPLAPVRNPLIPGYTNPVYHGGAAVPILTYSNERGIDNSYSFSFSTADGKQAQESGFLKDAFIDNNGEPQGTQVVEGSYAYISPEGTPIQVSYVADENGFRPSGVHIPAGGKGVLPIAPAIGIPAAGIPIPAAGIPIPAAVKDPKGIYDPIYNRYNPHHYHNPYYGQYNPLVNPRPYDPRYPYDPKYNLHPAYNPYRPWGLNKEAKDVPKKEAA